MKRFLYYLSFLSFLLFSKAEAQTGLNISVSISGLRDSSLFLAYHFGDKQYITDTIALDGNGKGSLIRNESLPQGIYMIVLPGKRYFEILLSDDQIFSVSCSFADFYSTLEFDGSEENTSFLKYQKNWALLQKEMTAIGKRIQGNRQNPDSLSILNPLQKRKEQQMRSYLTGVITENKPNLLSLLVKSMLPVEIPEFSIPSAIHNKDSAKWVMRYNYNTLHFFDNIDLTDERLLRTPILQARLEAYFKHDPIQFPDSINRKIDLLLKKSEPNHKIFQYVSVYLFNYYRESQIMGHDAIMVKLADDIYLNGKADWTTSEFREDLRKQVELLRNNLIGMKAKDLVMDSYKDVFVSLYDVEKRFTILYFWEPNCGHCKEATPKLKSYYDKEKQKENDIEVFSVCTISDKELWKKYIEENNLNWINGWDPQRRTNYDFYYNIQSTPMIYILDRNKRIIAKKLSIEDIPGFIENYRKFFK